MRLWDSKPQSGISEVLDSASYCYVLLPRRSCYYSTHRSYHISSSTHLGVSCLRPSISAYHTRSFSHLAFYRLRPRIPTSQPALLLPSGSYCVAFSPHLLLLLASHEILSRATRSCLSIASWRHQASLLLPHPSYPLSLKNTLNSGCRATHCVTVACHLPI